MEPVFTHHVLQRAKGARNRWVIVGALTAYYPDDKISVREELATFLMKNGITPTIKTMRKYRTARLPTENT